MEQLQDVIAAIAIKKSKLHLTFVLNAAHILLIERKFNMYISAIITAIGDGITTTFGAKIYPVQKGDIIIYNDKEFVVTDVKQYICFGQTQSLRVTMEHKEGMPCLK
jgi:hypothetical protein